MNPSPASSATIWSTAGPASPWRKVAGAVASNRASLGLRKVDDVPEAPSLGPTQTQAHPNGKRAGNLAESTDSRGSRRAGWPSGGGSADEVGQVAQQRGLRLGADDLLDDLTVLVDVQRGDPGHPVLRRGDGVLVDVHLDQADLVTVLRRDLVEDRGDLTARAAPLGPEVDQDGCVGLEDLG